MNIDKKTLRLYAVTDRTWLDGRTLYYDVEKALKGGVTLLQLREKNMSTDDFINSAKEIKSLCEKYNVPLIITTMWTWQKRLMQTVCISDKMICPLTRQEKSWVKTK